LLMLWEIGSSSCILTPSIHRRPTFQ
jgi:hypothetical protein